MTENEEKIEEPIDAQTERQPDEPVKTDTEPVEEETGESELHSILYGGEYSGYEDDLGAEEEHVTAAKKLKTFAETDDEKQAESKKPKTMTQKRITLISVIAGAVIAVIVLISIFASDIFAGSTTQKPLVLYEGEVADGTKRALIYEHIERDRIQKIEVKNEYGTYTAYYNNEAERFDFEGFEGAFYDEELFAQLVVSSGYPLISDRLFPEKPDDPEYMEEFLKEYGLYPDDDPSYFIITTRKDDNGEQTSYKLYIGKPTLTDNYYYCMLEGRSIVYVLEQSIKTTLLSDVKTLITPLLVYPISDNSYLTDVSEIQVVKNGEWLIKIHGQTEEEKAEGEDDFGVTIPYIVYYPFDYDASASRITTVLGQIINMTGSELLEYGVYDTVELYNEDGTRKLDEDGNPDYDYVLKEGLDEKYGLGHPTLAIYYRYQDMDMIVSLSEKQYDENGSAFYYALSELYNIIAKIDASNLTFLDWSLMDYIDKPIFSAHIDKVAEIELTAGDKAFRFTLTGIDDSLVCVENKYTTRTVFKGENTTDTSNDGIRNFRMLYQTILSIDREDFADEPSEDERALLCEMKVTFRNGDVKDYKFYSYSERRCFMTINDRGEFYVLRSMIKKLANDAVKLMNHEKIDPNAEY